MVADSLLTALKAALTSLSPTSLVAEHERLLQLRTALPALWLVPHSMHLREELSRPFEMTLDVLSTSAFVDLKALTGEQISVRLRQEDGSYRAWHAYVAGASQAGSDGGLAGYRLTCRSWLHSLGARINTHVYQDKTALQIVESIFSEYPQASWRVDASPDTLARMRVRAQCTQYRQTDLAMVTRLLAEEGLLFHFEHLDETAGAQADEAGHARHVLVITDAQSARQLLHPVRFTQPRPELNQPAPTGTISHLLRQTQAPLATATVAHWDAQALHGQAGQAGAGAQPEHYDGAAGIYDNAEQAQRAADQALAASELSALRYLGTGNARHLAAGAQLVVTEHPFGGGQLLAEPLALTLLSVAHWATNHLGQVGQAWKAGSPHELGAGEYRHQFEAAPAEASLAPPLPERPRAPLMLPATVVGLEQTRLTTERNLRVKVQFDFQRGERPNRAGLGYTPAVDGDAAVLGNAPGNEQSGTWIRMLAPVGGSDWGWVLPPRIGSEVVVCFAHGDIDQPVVVGSVYGETTPPPFAAGVDSGVNHPGTISGLHSRALDDAGGSQWVHDDAAGQLRLRIHNAQWGSELGLGHLIQQGLNSAQRGAWRGSGFEALTQGWAVARAAKGLLASTQARPGTYGSAQGSQMDVPEAVAHLNAARDLGQRLGAAAGAVGAQGLTGHADEQAVPSIVKLIDLEQDGRHEGEAFTAPDDERAGAGQPVPAFAEPLVVLDGASSLLAASGASTQLYAIKSLSVTAQGDLQQTAGHTYAQVSGQGASLYAHKGGITAHAANGPVSIRTHTDVFQLLVEQGATVSSVNDEIRIFAKDKLSFGAADSGFELNGPDITFTTPGTYKEQGGTHAFLPGGNAAAQLTALPRSVVGELPTLLELDYRYRDLTPVVGAPYIVRFNDGTVREGVLDGQGRAQIENPPDAGRVFFGYDSREAQPKRERAANGSIGQTAQTPEEAQAILAQYLEAEDEYLADNYFEDEIAGMADVEFEDLIDDYVYDEEAEEPEDDQSPGTHEEHMVEESQGERA